MAAAAVAYGAAPFGGCDLIEMERQDAKKRRAAAAAARGTAPSGGRGVATVASGQGKVKIVSNNIKLQNVNSTPVANNFTSKYSYHAINTPYAVNIFALKNIHAYDRASVFNEF